MSPPKRLVNTFIKTRNKPVIDLVSKIFIILELVLGSNRLALLGVNKKIYVVSMFCYSISLNIVVIYCAISMFECCTLMQFYMMLDMIRFVINTILAYFLHLRLEKFYCELNRFDNDVECKDAKSIPKISVVNFIRVLILIISSYAFYKIAYKISFSSMLILLLLKLLHYLELNYYAHLFIIVKPRISLIKYYVNYSYPNRNDSNSEENFSNNSSIKGMNKTQQFYKRIITIYSYLYESIKWQMLIFIIITFANTLGMSCDIFKFVINSNFEDDVMWNNVIFLLIDLVPLFTPCVYADQICDEVRQLKDDLSSKLYSNTLDKPSRSSTRTLLALIDTDDLSFSLFHLFNIDITLPFKFLALLLTYLIIILQFEKVTNPNLGD